MSREDVLVSADWAEQNLSPPESSSSRSTKTPRPMTVATSPARSSWTGRPICRTRFAGTSSARSSSRSCCRRTGISNDDTVVLYGGNNNWFAAYAYWYFKLYGHQNVKLLDGGRKKWELDGRELSKETVERGADHVHRAADQDTSIRAFRDEVVDAIGMKNLVDVRSPDEFAGQLLAPAHLPQEQAQRAGHIPTAINVPWSKAANEDGTFKSDDELRALYGDAGLDDGQRHDRVLPYRRAVQPHLVRAARAARPPERQELRRLLDRVRLARRRPDREGRLTCAEHLPNRPVLPPNVDVDEGDGHLRRRKQGRRARARRLRAAARRHR